MKRAAFTTSAFAALVAAPARDALALPAPAEVRTAAARIPGITAVYARTLEQGAPLVSLRANERFAAASVIKLPIMVTAFRAFDAGTAAPNDEVALRAADLIGGSPVLAGAHAGQRFTLRALIDAMIRQSDNSASNTLISAFGFAAINGVIARLGMTHTHLGRHFADVVPSGYVSLNVTSARDIGTLLYALENGSREGLDTIARSSSCRAMIDVLLGQEDRSKIADGLPRGTPCANKTGEIDRVRNDAAIVDPYGDTPFILVVLTRELENTTTGDRGIAAIARKVNAIVRG